MASGVKHLVLLVCLVLAGWGTGLRSAAASPLSPLACAGDCSIANGNAVAVINSGTGTGNTGMKSLTIDGQSQLNRDWLWYRVGAAGPERSIDTLTFNGGYLLDNNGSGDYETYVAQYAGAGFTVTFYDILAGGSLGSHTADVRQSVYVVNTMSVGSLDFHLFMYTDYDLAGTSGGDSVSMPNDHTIDQFDGAVHAETTVSHAPSVRYQYGAAGGILAQLTDGLPDTLSNLPALGTEVGPGDQAWALQWDASIVAGDEYIATADKNVWAVPPRTSPEPAVLGIFALAVLLLGGAHRGPKCRKILQLCIFRKTLNI